MTSTEHPLPGDFARAISLGPDETMIEHLATCGECSRERESFVRLRVLARELPEAVPEPFEMRAVRARVLAEAEILRRRSGLKRTILFVGFAAAAGVGLAIGVHRPRETTFDRAEAQHFRGTVTALSAARFTHASGAPDEIVRLDSGTVHVEVTPLRPGERFRVFAGDGEVEVRGTAFDVGVADGHMTLVHVSHGRVEVRPRADPATVLEGGGDWRSASRPTEADPRDVSSVAASPTSNELPEAPRRPPASGAPTPRKQAAPSGRTESTVEAPVSPAQTVDAAPLTNALAQPALASAPDTAPTSRAAPIAAPPNAAPAPTDSERMQDRRERRDERRERYDERRWR